MKKLLFLISLFVSIQTFAQSPDVFVFTQVASSRYRSSDSIQVWFQLSTNNASAPAQITSITQTAGPAVKFSVNPSWITGTTVNSAFWLQGLAPGVYSFTATAKSSSGTTGSYTSTFTVIADPVCPICPPIPAPRILSSVTVKVGNQTITLSAAELQNIKYGDGSTQ